MMVQGSGFGDWGMGFRVWVFRVWGMGCKVSVRRVQGSELMVWGFSGRLQVSGFRFQGSGFRVQILRLRH